MRIILLLAAMAAPATMAPATMASATEVIRLSDAQRQAVLDAAARGPEKDAVLTPEQAQRQSVLDRSLYPEFYGQNGGPAAPDRKVHGEVTMFAGAGGTFGMSGTAILPVGDTGTAAVSIMQGTSNYGGLQGFSLGYASNGNALGRGYGYGSLGYGGGLGLWNNPWAFGGFGPQRQFRRRR